MYLITTAFDPGDIRTVAGTGTFGFGGDGAAATSAKLRFPRGVAVDSSGNLFIADESNQRIRKVDTSGNISTVAGDGTRAFGGDGGSATSAQLNRPFGIAVDSSGNIFIGDQSNSHIRKVDTSGNISTVAGTSTVSGFSGDGGPATSAKLKDPLGVAVDSSGNLFIADSGNHRIRKVDTSGIITTVAGTGTAGFSGDGGPATSAQLDGPTGVAMDSSGNLFIADEGNERIRKVDTSGNISTVAGTGAFGFSGDGGPATSAQFDRPKAVAVDSLGNLFIADENNSRIRKVDTSGNISTVAGGGSGGLGDGSAATSAQLAGPQSVAVDSSGNVFIGDTSHDRIRKVAAAPRTDLAVTMTDLPDPIHTGNKLTYSITITNNGPNTANSVTVTDTLPSGVTFVSSTPGQGSCSGTSTVTCNLGTLANGATATVTIATTVTATSGFSNTASVSATEGDPSSGNDSATASTSILAPGAIPSLSAWGLVGLALLMVGAVLVMMRRRSVRQA